MKVTKEINREYREAIENKQTFVIGTIEIGTAYIHIEEFNNKLIAGTACNIGLLPDYYIEIDDCFSLDENLQAFIEELEELQSK